MKKNDKLVVILGVLVLVIASIGIYYYSYDSDKYGKADIDDFIHVTGVYKQDFNYKSISVLDENPFYALAATPLAVHYCAEGKQEVMPLYVKNYESPSNSILKLQQRKLYGYDEIDLMKDNDNISAKDFSLQLAEKYWARSEAALLIEDSKEGYCLGINAIPMASYLSIPIIIADGLDEKVEDVLTTLEVEKIVICGENFKGYEEDYKYLKFDNVEQIAENMSYLLMKKFGEFDYITITNPIDAWPPEVLDSESFDFETKTVASSSMNRGSTIKFVIDFFSKSVSWEFTIPEDYKYALVQVKGINHEIDGVDEYGDSASFTLDPVHDAPTLGGPSTTNGLAVRDEKGNIIEDQVYVERVLYDCGGKTYRLTASGSWTLLKEGKVSAKVVVKKLEHPVYEPMGGLSSVAPYLTAYHKGIVFGKTDFAFTADDDVITKNGETCPGFYLAGRNPALIPMANQHMYDNVHEPINELLAKLANKDYNSNNDLKKLTDHYKDNPVYVALVGGGTVLPQITYQNYVEPIHDVDDDGIDDTVALNFGGGGTQSDNLYANIDPKDGEWDNEAGDYFSEYPYLENIVGRITGYDVQDADALIVRTIFYEDIIDDLGQWKNNFGNVYGGGVDFQKPLWVQIINHIPGVKQILNILNTASGGFLNLAVGPWKCDTGSSVYSSLAIEHDIANDLGFDVTTLLHEEAMLDGFTDEALDKMKTTSLWNQLTFSKGQVKDLAGEGNVKGREVIENSNYLWLTGHGSIYNFGMDGPDLVNAGFDGIFLNAPRLWQNILKKVISPYFVVGFWGPGGHLGKIGEYSPRAVTTVDFGPSFLWLESCFCGKIYGVYPEENIGQAFIHAGVNAMVAATTGSNIPGGYLEPKDKMYDTFWKVNKMERIWENKAEQGEYPDFHFGVKIYNDMCHYLVEEDLTMGQAFRDAKNVYLPEDADWELWWSPPLSALGYSSASAGGGDEGFGTHMAAKYTSFHEYVLYGDPAFNPYEPQ